MVIVEPDSQLWQTPIQEQDVDNLFQASQFTLKDTKDTKQEELEHGDDGYIDVAEEISFHISQGRSRLMGIDESHDQSKEE